MPSVSLCMIVRNEAHQLADCLAPVAGLFSDIVIVDTGSIDGTREVAHRFTPRVVDFPWCDDFSAARNAGLSHATGDWIFWLDADDRLSPDNIAKLRSLIESLPDRPQAYLLDTVCRPADVCDPERLVTHQRLFRRHPRLAWCGRVHEQLRPCPSTLGYELIYSDVRIDHLGYSDAALTQKKLQRDVRLLRMDYAVDPNEPATLLHLGVAHARLGRLSEARQYLTRVLALQQQPATYLRRVYTALAEVGLHEGAMESVVETVNQALAMFPGDEHLMYLQAEALYELDRYAEAQAQLMAIVQSSAAPQYHGGAPDQLRAKLAPRSLGEVLRIQGRTTAAEAVLRRVVKAFPLDTMSWHALGRVYIDLANRPQFAAVCERLNACPQGRAFALLLTAAWQLARNELAGLPEVFDELIAIAPRMPMPRVLRAMWLARSGASLHDQMQACQDVLRVQPGNQFAESALARLRQAEATPRSAAPAPAPADWGTSVVVVSAG